MQLQVKEITYIRIKIDKDCRVKRIEIIRFINLKFLIIKGDYGDFN